MSTLTTIFKLKAGNSDQFIEGLKNIRPNADKKDYFVTMTNLQNNLQKKFREQSLNLDVILDTTENSVGSIEADIYMISQNSDEKTLQSIRKVIGQTCNIDLGNDPKEALRKNGITEHPMPA